MLHQFDIFWVDLNPTRGAETYKQRPCVILQSTAMNRGSRTVVVAPLLPGHKSWPFAVNIRPSERNHLDKDRHINVKQLRAVDLSRLSNQYGILDPAYHEPVREAVALVFEL